MNEATETVKKEVTEVCDKVSRISDYRMKSDYDITLSIFDRHHREDGGCVHHLKGSMDRNLMCTLALAGITVGAIGAAICLFHMCCGICCKSR